MYQDTDGWRNKLPVQRAVQCSLAWSHLVVITKLGPGFVLSAHISICVSEGLTFRQQGNAVFNSTRVLHSR